MLRFYAVSLSLICKSNFQRISVVNFIKTANMTVSYYFQRGIDVCFEIPGICLMPGQLIEEEPEPPRKVTLHSNPRELHDQILQETHKL